MSPHRRPGPGTLGSPDTPAPDHGAAYRGAPALGPDRHDDVIVASFLDSATDAFRGFAPSVPTSAGTAATAEAWRAVQAGEDVPDSPAVAYQVPERQGDLVVVDERFVAAAHRGGKAVHVWTVNDAASMERLVDLGVDGIISDVPTTLCSVLGARRVDWGGL